MASEKTVVFEERSAREPERAEVAPGRARRLKLTILIAATLTAGLLGRALVGDGAADNPLFNWLPWLNRTNVTLYFGEDTGDYLVPVSRELSRRAEPHALAAALLSGPEAGTGLVSLIPEGTILRSAVVVEGSLQVDLGGDHQKLAARPARDALLHSFASWPGVEDVRITVAGVPLGGARSPGHLLYFYDEDRDMLVAQPTPAVGLRDVVSAYLTGPGEARLTGLPDDVRALSFDLAADRGLLKLDFTYTPSVRRYAVDHPDGMRRVLEGLLATLTTGFPEIDAVWLDFEGHEALGVGQCADLLRSAQTRPDPLNDERLLKRSTGA